MVTRIQTVNVPELPPANGHYSHGIRFNGTLYASGQLGRGPLMTDPEAGDIERQTRRSLSNLQAVLRASGCDFQDLLKVNVYISDISQWSSADAVYGEMMGSHRPARTIIPTNGLHFGSLVEIDAIAALP